MITFALATLTLVFFLQALTVLFGVSFAIAYQTLFPTFKPAPLLLAMGPVCALLAPAFPFSKLVHRRTLLTGAAMAVALSRILLCLPDFPARMVASTLIVGAGGIFLANLVSVAERGAVAAAVAVAFVLESLLRVAGWSYDVTLRASWLPLQVVVSALVVAGALLWRRDHASSAAVSGEAAAAPVVAGIPSSGALAFGCILFFQLNLLARAEVVHRWIELPYTTVAPTLIGGGVLAALLLLMWPAAASERRSTALLLVALMLVGVFAACTSSGPRTASLGMVAVGHGAGLLLLPRVLRPSAGYAEWRLSVSLGAVLVLSCVWIFTFFYAFISAVFEGRAAVVLIIAAIILSAAVSLMPAAAGSQASAPLPRRAIVLFVGLVALAAVPSALHLRRPRSVDANTPSDAITVATFNIRYGYDEDWRYDPERIARTIEGSGARVVALQEVAAGMISAYGTDLGVWLERRLGMRSLFAPSINGLLGDAILTALPVLSFTSELLPPEGSDPKQLARAALGGGRDTLIVYATHFGLHVEERRAQIEHSIQLIPAGPAVFMGDLNAEDGSEVIRHLGDAGFRDAFELAGVPGTPTSPAKDPRHRIDWIWVRGYGVTEAEVSPGGGSDHRLVAARLRLR